MNEPTIGVTPSDPAGYAQQLGAFAVELRRLRATCGQPWLRAVASAAPPARPLSVSAVSEALAGKRLPRLDFLIALVRTLLTFQEGRPVSRDDARVKQWHSRWQEVELAKPRGRPSELQAETVAPPSAVRIVRPQMVPGAPGPRRHPPAAPKEPAAEGYTLLQTTDGHFDPVRSVAFSPDGRLLASGGDDMRVRLWDPVSRQLVGRPLVGHFGAVRSVAFSPDGRLLASGGDDMRVRLWDTASGLAIGPPLTGMPGGVSAVAFSPTDHLLAGAGDARRIWLWDTATGSRVDRLLAGHTGAVRSVVFSPDGELLASASNDKTIRLWDPASRQLVGRPLAGHSGTVRSVAFSPDGRLLASGGDDMQVRLWDTASGQAIGQPLAGHSGPVRSVAFSPDGRLLAIANGTQTVRLWELARLLERQAPRA